MDRIAALEFLLSKRKTKLYDNNVRGRLYFWGRPWSYWDEFGQKNEIPTPREVLPNDDDRIWIDVVSGQQSYIALTENGDLYGWGGNIYGELANPTLAFVQSNRPILSTTVPWKQVAMGHYHAIAIKEDGTLWSWGYNAYGQLGLGYSDEEAHIVPTQVGSFTDWEYVAAGGYHSAGIRDNGKLYTWGNNNRGQLGQWDLITGAPTMVTVPTIEFLNIPDWDYVACGETHTFAIRDTQLWSCGNNASGQGGFIKSPTCYNTFTKIIHNGAGYNNVSCGYRHTLATTKYGGLMSCGITIAIGRPIGASSEWGLLGKIGNDSDWIRAFAGYNHSAALKENGTLWSWGYNAYGQLGLGHTNTTAEPEQVAGYDNWQKVVCFYDRTVAIRGTD